MNEYIQEFKINNRELELIEIVKGYFDRTEAHDKRVCSGVSPYDGCAMPVTDWQFQRVNINALQERKYVEKIALGKGFSSDEFRKAFKDYTKNHA